MNKIKGITVWEQNAEYFALGIATLALIVFVAMQFIGDSNTVTVSGHGTVGPGDVDRRLEDEATRLNRLLSPEAEPPIDTREPEPVLPRVQQAMASGISPQSQLRNVHVHIPLTPGERPRMGEPFVVPEVPQPTMTVAQQYFDTLEDGVVDEFEQIRSQVGSAPYDITWITPASAIDLDTILESFREEGPNGEAPIPTSWHGGRATVLDIRIEREEYVDGQWRNLTMLEPLPGQYSFRPDLEDVDAMRRDAIVRTARDASVQRMVGQPSFFPTRSGAFLPPDPLAADADFEDVAGDEDDEVRRNRIRLIELERERARVAERLEQLGGPLDGSRPGTERDRPGSAPPPPPGGSTGPGFGARDGTADQDRARREDQRNEAARRNMTRRIETLDRQIEEVRQRLPEDEVIETELDDTEFGGGMFVVWGHDMDVQPGRTYRYRVTVDIYNPYFARRLNLVDEQQHMADSIVFSSPASEWSEPIQARAPLHPFVTRAYAPGQERGVTSRQGTGRATVEVYRFHDGRWWREQFNVEPGQRIGTRRQESGRDIDFGTEWFVLDIIEDMDTSGRDGGGTLPGQEGRAARVVLQNMHNGDVMEIRHPRRDIGNPDRQRLQDEARWADAG